MELINPKNNQLLKSLPEATPLEVKEGFLRAKEAQLLFQARPFSERAQVISRFKAALSESSEKIAMTQCLATGKPLSQCRGELSATLTRIDYFLQQTEGLLKSQLVNSKGIKEEITQEPLGVILNISAWNYPLFVGSNIFIPALLTGNAVLYKPSESTAELGLIFKELFDQSGLAPYLFQSFTGGPEVGEALLDEAIDGIFFTGSFATGQKIRQRLAKRLIPGVYELGGKDPAYVREDAAITKAAQGLCEGGFYNAGQSCCGVERIYVHKAIYDDFLTAFVKEAQNWLLGDPLLETTKVGPLTRKEQVAFLANQVADALKKGARILYQGELPDKESELAKGHYFPPTVLTDVNHSMALMREESFGPIIGIQKVSDDEEALSLMNDTDYGLTASIYTRDEQKAREILRGLQVGSAYINCCDRVVPTLPWSGRRQSGVGSSLGKGGILAFLQPKAWHVKI